MARIARQQQERDRQVIRLACLTREPVADIQAIIADLALTTPFGWDDLAANCDIHLREGRERTVREWSEMFRERLRINAANH